MRKLFLVAAIVTAGACSRPIMTDGPIQQTTGRIAAPAQTCIPYETTQSLRVLDPRTLAYGWGRTIYINHLDAACPGLRPTSTLVVEPNGSQYCRGDRVRTLEAGTAVPGPTCLLGAWVPYRKP